MPSHQEIGARMMSRPLLMLRMFIGLKLFAPFVTLLGSLTEWFSGIKRVAIFGILFNPDLGYCVKVNGRIQGMSGEDLQWYDDIEQAATALTYHLSAWKSTLPKEPGAPE